MQQVVEAVDPSTADQLPGPGPEGAHQVGGRECAWGGSRAGRRRHVHYSPLTLTKLPPLMTTDRIPPPLRPYYRIARLKPEVCEVVLPLAVVSLATSIEVARERPELRGILAAAISQHVMADGSDSLNDGAPHFLGGRAGGSGEGGPMRPSDPRAVRLMLGCLERLRR